MPICRKTVENKTEFVRKRKQRTHSSTHISMTRVQNVLQLWSRLQTWIASHCSSIRTLRWSDTTVSTLLLWQPTTVLFFSALCALTHIHFAFLFPTSAAQLWIVTATPRLLQVNGIIQGNDFEKSAPASRTRSRMWVRAYLFNSNGRKDGGGDGLGWLERPIKLVADTSGRSSHNWIQTWRGCFPANDGCLVLNTTPSNCTLTSNS